MSFSTALLSSSFLVALSSMSVFEGLSSIHLLNVKAFPVDAGSDTKIEESKGADGRRCRRIVRLMIIIRSSSD